MSSSIHLKLIHGGDVLHQVDLTDLLENMDLRDALPRLRALSRRRRPAANSVLSVVEPGQKIRVIDTEWDDDAGVWVATSDDVPGLVTEGATLESMADKLKHLVPELLDANGIEDF